MTDTAPAPQAIRVSAVAVDDVVELLSRSGVDGAAELVWTHLSDGLPQNEDGTVSLIVYAAWLLKQGAGR